MEPVAERSPPPGADPRLRACAGTAGAALALSALAPCETWHDGACFVWQLAPDLRPASLWVLLAPGVCGALLIAGALLCRRAFSLAVLALAAVAGLFAVAAVGVEALAWDLLPQPEVWSHGPAPGILAVACTAAGLWLSPETATRRAARGLLAAAVPCGLAHLLLPACGESPVRLTARVMAHVVSSSGVGNVLSATVLVLVVLWPAVAVAVGWAHARRPAERGRSAAAVLLAYGAPVTLLPFVERSLISPDRGAADAGTMLGGVLVLAGTLVALAAALSFLARWAAGLSTMPARGERRTLLVAMGVVVFASAGTSRWARPESTQVASPPGPATPEGDRVFGMLLSNWNDARAAVDLHTPPKDGLDATAAEAALVASARDLGGDLGSALAALASGSAQPGLPERRWYGLVDRVNAASRRGGLPYYVDPTEVVGVDGPPPGRWFRVDAYRIEGARGFTHAGRALATLRVRALSPERTRLGSLGLSRDVQPFAVVALDAIDAYRDELQQLAARTPPRCSAAPGESAAAEHALQACGAVLASLAREGDLGAALLATTERHELQHQIDGPAMTPSRWLAPRIAWQPSGQRDRIGRELSAYLAQMTAPDPAPRLTLLRLLRLALLVRTGVEHRVALLAFEAMGDEEVARGDAAARAYLRLSALDDAGLRAHAERAWREVYGGELGVVAPR